MAKNVSKIALLAAAAFMLAYLPACSGDDGESDSSSVAVTGVTVSPDKATLYVSGDDASKIATLTATVAPENATDKTVTWFSSDSTVAEVSPATGNEITVTAKSAGVATLTAKAADDKTATVQLTVFADRDSEVMFKLIAGTTYKVGEQSVSIDEFGFVTVGGKKSDKPAVFDDSKLTVIIDGTSHEITVKDDNLTFDGTTGKKLKPTLTKNNDEPVEYDTIKAAFAAIPTTGTDTYTITLQSGTYSENGLSYNGSATVVIAGEPNEKYGKDVVIMGKGSSQEDSKSRCLLYVGGTANIVLKNVTLQNTLKRNDPDIPTDAKGNKLTQAEAFGFGSNGTVTAYNASFLSHQDTVRTVGKAWFYQCYFEGDVDFLWMETSGQVALYENCEIKMVGDDTDKAYVAAPGLAQTSPVGKGLVIYNSKVSIDSQLAEAYLARTPWTENKYNQVAYINTTVDGTLKAVWAGAPIATEFPKTDIGWKLCPVTAAACEHTGEDVLSARMTAREYNGRYVILNRVFDTKTKQYKTAETLWDAAKDLGITDDASKNNIFLDYADVTKTSIGDELVVTDYSGRATDVLWTVKAFKKYENGVLSEPVDGLTIADGKVTVASSLTGNFYAEVTAKKGNASDSLILYNVTATAISLSQTAVSIAEGSDVQLTATFEPEGADAEVVWTSSDPTIATVDDGGKVIAQSGKASSTATITATIKGTDIKATCEVTVTAAVSLKKFGTSVAGASSTNYNTIGKDEYLLYPVPIKAGEAYAIEAKITYTSVANIGVGIVAFKDGAYFDGVVSRYAFATPAGVKATPGGQGYSPANNTESDGVYIVKAYTKQDSENLFFSLTTPNGVELTKDYTMSYYVPAETDSIYLAIGGVSVGGASVSANDITITVGDAAPAKVAKFEDLAADTRTELSVGGTVSYTIAATETSANGTKFSIPLTADMLSGLSVTPNATGTWSWDATAVETPNGKDIAATATFIPDDRAQYKAIISHEVTIAVTDERATSNATFVTIKYFDTTERKTATTPSGGDDKIKASNVGFKGITLDSNAQFASSSTSENGTKDLTKYWYVKLSVDSSVSATLTGFEGKGSYSSATDNQTIFYYLATSLPETLTEEIVSGWKPLGKATKKITTFGGDVATFSESVSISGDVYIVVFPTVASGKKGGSSPITIDVSYE